MTKTQINNCAAVALIFKKSKPSQLFIQQKDAGLPNKFGADLALCPFGGSWLGEEAKGDTGPLDTIARELDEELFVTTSAGELARPPELQNVLEAIVKALVPYQSTLSETASAVWSLPEKQRPSFVALHWYFVAALEDADWEDLVSLHNQFGSLTHEGTSRVTSLQQVLQDNLCCAYGHDQILQNFWLHHGYEEAKTMFIYPNPPTIEVGWLDTYVEVLQNYQVAKTPWN